MEETETVDQEAEVEEQEVEEARKKQKSYPLPPKETAGGKFPLKIDGSEIEYIVVVPKGCEVKYPITTYPGYPSAYPGYGYPAPKEEKEAAKAAQEETKKKLEALQKENEELKKELSAYAEKEKMAVVEEIVKEKLSRNLISDASKEVEDLKKYDTSALRLVLSTIKSMPKPEVQQPKAQKTEKVELSDEEKLEKEVHMKLFGTAEPLKWE